MIDKTEQEEYIKALEDAVLNNAIHEEEEGYQRCGCCPARGWAVYLTDHNVKCLYRIIAMRNPERRF